MTIEESYTSTADLGSVEIPPELQPYMTKLLILQKENTELKRLLRLAVEDFDYIYQEHSCTTMKLCSTDCPYSGESYCKGNWKHADEAEKLIGGEE